MVDSPVFYVLHLQSNSYTCLLLHSMFYNVRVRGPKGHDPRTSYFLLQPWETVPTPQHNKPNIQSHYWKNWYLLQPLLSGPCVTPARSGLWSCRVPARGKNSKQCLLEVCAFLGHDWLRSSGPSAAPAHDPSECTCCPCWESRTTGSRICEHHRRCCNLCPIWWKPP